MRTQIIGCVLAALASWCRGGPLVLVKDGKPQGAIVLPARATPAQTRGAEELQSHLQNISGARPPIIRDDQPLPEHAIVLGYGKYTQQLGIREDPSLGADGFVLKTLGSRVVIAGPGPRGTMYGCTSILEKLGVRWFTPTVTRFPHQTTVELPELNETHVPAFEYRDISFAEARNKDWAARMRLNGQSAALDVTTGGNVVYYHSVHTLDDLVPRDLFLLHPDYFPLIKGQRTNGYVQRCLSNPEVLRITIERVKQWIREAPGAQLYSVSQNDTGNWCECEQCTAIANRYGGQSGLYLWFANQVADAIARDHPDKLIDTLAYQFTEAPPTGIAPRKNVRVRLCPIACCCAHPYETCSTPQDREFVEHLRGWARITDTLYIWHYGTDFANFLLPFPNFGEFPAEFRLYRKSEVKGVFVEGDYARGGGADEAELRSYVMAHLLWDPAAEDDAMVTDWMKGVYGKAWGPMRQWFDLLHQGARPPEAHFFLGANATAPYLSDQVLKSGDELLKQAAQMAAGDWVAADYVAKAAMWLHYAQLIRHPAAGPELETFLAEVRRRGITYFSEQLTAAQWEQEYRMRVRMPPAAR